MDSSGRAIGQVRHGSRRAHNFKVAFGFREFGKDTDGGVENGPFWDALAEITREATYDRSQENLICSPIEVKVIDEKAFDQASKRISTEADESVTWAYTLNDTVVTKTPGDTGTTVWKFAKIAVPVLDVYPPTAEGQKTIPPTHLEVLLPSGKSGWIPAAAAHMLFPDRLCYARTRDGDWRIANYNQNE